MPARVAGGAKMERDAAHPVQPLPITTEQSQVEQGLIDRLLAIRKSYAEHIMTLAGVASGTGIRSAITAAFASIPREKFVEPPPWNLLSSAAEMPIISDDPVALYQNVLVPLGAGRGLNNGQPSLHALCMNALAPTRGESVVHVGAGTGYYTAALAMLVGETGKVDAYEIHPELARRAGANLAEFPQVEVHCRSGAEGPLPDCDVLYVNAAAPAPLAVWLDALHPGGRLLFPLEAQGDSGEMLLVTRRTDGPYPARFLCGVQFVPCIGAQNARAARALEAAFRKGNSNQVKWLYRNDQPDESCWCAGPGWWLSTASQSRVSVPLSC